MGKNIRHRLKDALKQLNPAEQEVFHRFTETYGLDVAVRYMNVCIAGRTAEPARINAHAEDPQRLVLKLLCNQPPSNGLSSAVMADRLGYSQSGMYMHLNALVKSGRIVRFKKGRTWYYSSALNALSNRDSGLLACV
jgi:hypothetical protein